jgi:hypothetical protein
MIHMILHRRATLLFCATALALFAQDTPRQPAQMATLSFTVVRESSGKPVRNAEIVLHLLDKNGNQKQEGLELKSHEDGKAETGGVPYGKMRVQVIASGFRTYGEDFNIDKPTLEITVKLQKPKEQFSIYK